MCARVRPEKIVLKTDAHPQAGRSSADGQDLFTKCLEALELTARGGVEQFCRCGK